MNKTRAMVVTGLAGALLAWVMLQVGGPRESNGGEPRTVSEDELSEDRQAAPELSSIEDRTLRALVASDVGASDVVASDAGASTLDRDAKVSVRFVDAAGSGIADVLVLEEAAGDLRLATSGPDGLARIRLQPPHGDDRQWVTTLVAEKSGYAARRLRVKLWPGEEVLLGDVLLARGGLVSGIVLTEAGLPSAGSRVGITTDTRASARSERDERLSGPRDIGEHAAVHSAEDGSFTVGGTPIGWIRVWGRKDKGPYCFTQPLFVQPEEPLVGVTLTVQERGQDEFIAGVVLGPDRTPVGGAAIDYTYRSVDEGGSGALRGGSGSLRADENGEFALVHKGHEFYELKGWDPRGRYGAGFVEVAQPGKEPVEIVLARADSLHVVVALETGDPVDECLIETRSAGRTIGRYRFEEPCPSPGYEIPRPSATFALGVSASGYRPRGVGPWEPESAPSTVVVELEKAPAISGTVRSVHGPVAGAQVELKKSIEGGVAFVGVFQSRLELAPRARARTDEQGRFSLPVTKPGTYYLIARSEGFAAAFDGPFSAELDQGDSVRDLYLSKGGAIEGIVVEGDGVTVAGAVVGVSRGDGSPLTRRSDADGKFSFTHLTPGMWQVVLLDEEPDPDPGFVGFMPELDEDAWDCQVVEGRVSEVVLERAP